MKSRQVVRNRCPVRVRIHSLIEGRMSLSFASHGFQTQERREVREVKSEDLVRSWSGLRRTNLD